MIENLYQMTEATVKRLVPDYDSTKAEWIYPVYNKEIDVNYFVIMLVNPFVILDQKAYFTLQIRMDLLYQSIMNRKPSRNGFYAFLVYTEKYEIPSIGSIAVASEESIEIMMGERMTIEEMQLLNPIKTLQHSKSGFSEVYNAIKSQLDHVIVDGSNGIKYHVQWKKSDVVGSILLIVIPIDELKASWEMKPSKIPFYFAESIDKKKVNISIGDTELFNTGDYVLRWNLKYPKANIVTIPSEGVLQPRTSVKLSYYMKNLNGERNSIAFDTYGDNSNCYEPLVVLLNQTDYSCRESNYYAVLDKKCESFHRNVYFEWNDSRICQLGIPLPETEEIECSILYNYIYFLLLYNR